MEGSKAAFNCIFCFTDEVSSFQSYQSSAQLAKHSLWNIQQSGLISAGLSSCCLGHVHHSFPDTALRKRKGHKRMPSEPHSWRTCFSLGFRSHLNVLFCCSLSGCLVSLGSGGGTPACRDRGDRGWGEEVGERGRSNVRTYGRRGWLTCVMAGWILRLALCGRGERVPTGPSPSVSLSFPLLPAHSH